MLTLTRLDSQIVIPDMMLIVLEVLNTFYISTKMKVKCIDLHWLSTISQHSKTDVVLG